MRKGKAIASVVLLLVLLSLSTVAFANSGEDNGNGSPAEKIERARERFEQAQQNFLNAKDRFEDAKTKWLDAKDKWQRFNRASDRNEFLDKAKIYMLRSTDHLINYLEVTEKRAQKLENLDEADLNSITSQIDAELAKLEALKAEIEATDSNNLSAIAQKVKDEWNTVKAFSKKIVGLILAANTNKAISVAEKIGDKAEAKIAGLDQNGLDTNSANAALAAFRSHIQLAKDKRTEAVAKFLQITDLNSSQQLFKEGHDLLKEARDHLKEAHKSLKDIIREIVKAKKPANTGSDDEDQNQPEDESD